MENDNLIRRLRNDVILLEDGHSLKVGDLTLSSKNHQKITVIGWSNAKIFENIKQERAIEELENTKALFKYYLTISIELKEFVRSRTIEYALAYDDYGKVSVPICEEVDNQITWISKFQD